MTPQGLAGEVETMIALCTERITGVGAQQYHVEGQPQKFETMSFDALAEYYEEELRDIVNYAVMTHIRLRRIREAFVSRLLLQAGEHEVHASWEDDGGHGVRFRADGSWGRDNDE